ncbi:MAG TPA: response regulator [Ktedonobacteraceae bacterium]
MIDITARLQRREQAARLSLAQTTTHLNHEDEGASCPLILVIEDHAATQNVLTSVLDLQGYQVVCMANGREALEWLERALQTEQRPGIILLDLFMPVMNGADFLANMRASWPGTEPVPPVILFTVDQGNHDDLACSEVLLKPFHIRDLLAKIKLLLDTTQVYPY